MGLLILAVLKLLQLYMLLIIVYSFGGMFPSWRFQAWYRWVAEFVYPYLSLFKGLRLPGGGSGGATPIAGRSQFRSGVDFTPLLGLVVLQLIAIALRSAL